MSTVVNNWAGSASARPEHLWKPRTAEHVRTVVDRAVGAGQRVRVIGAGHSFSSIALSQDHQLNLDLLSGIVSHDAARKRVRFAAGTRLRDIPALLEPLGLALTNQGDVDPQSLAGAVSTGTHGTGLAFTGFAGTVTGMTVLTATGETLRLSADENPEIFDLARISLGMFGVLLEIEIQCVDAFDLVAQETAERLDEVLDVFSDRARVHDHVEFYWFPHTDVVSVKTNTRVAPGDQAPGDLARVPRRHPAARFLSEEILDNGGLRAICEIGRAAPALIPSLNRLAGYAVSNRAYRAPSHEVFISPRRVRFNEMEYAVPIHAAPAVLREVRAMIERKGWRISFPVEVRISASDDVPLSTACGRETAYIAVHRFYREDHREYFREVEKVLRAHEGRPHWGKLHSLEREDLDALYPRFGDFCAMRERLDPAGTFGNAYTDRLFGVAR